MIDISEFQLTNVPSTAYYIPNFIDEHEEQAIIKEVNRAPKSKWVKLSNRRLQNILFYVKKCCLDDESPEIPNSLLFIYINEYIEFDSTKIS